MAVSLEVLKEYLRLMPDESPVIAQLALDAAIEKARGAGVPDYEDNAYYDLFIYALASAWYDNRNLQAPGTNQNGADAMQKLVNQFVLELRYRGDADG